MSGSVYITKQFEFIEKKIAERKRKRFKNSLFLSLTFHALFIIGVTLFAFSPFSKKDLQSKIFVVEHAEYKPFPSENKPAPPDAPVEKAVEPEQKPAVVEQKQKPTLPEKYRTQPDLSWRENVSKIIPEKKPPAVISKITVSKAVSEKPVVAAQPSGVSPRQVNSYLAGLASIFRSHWTIPEDIAHKCYGKVTEIEVSIDLLGNIKSATVVKSFGDADCDFYARDAALKTKQIPLPPKEMFESLFLSDKITLEFKP